MGTTTIDDLADELQEVYNGALVECFPKKAPAIERLRGHGLVLVKNVAELRWGATSESPGVATTIVDGGTLPAASDEEITKAELQWKIFIKIVRVGRVLQIASRNGGLEFYKTAAGIDYITQKINRFIPWLAKTIHNQIVALDTSVATDIVCLGDAIGKNNNTYAGINRVTDTYWQPYVNANSGVNRTLTVAHLEDMVSNLKLRDAETTEVWSGDTAWNATRDIIKADAPARNVDPEILKSGAKVIYWEGIPFINMLGMDPNAQFWLDLSSEEDGVSLVRQHDEDTLIRPESSNNYDDRMSAAGHWQLKVGNPSKQGSLLDVA